MFLYMSLSFHSIFFLYIEYIIHMRVKYTDMQHIYIHRYIYIHMYYIYMHACMYCNVCVCACVIPLCDIVLHICAMFFFTLFSLFSYDLKFLQGKRRPQEMLWNCTAWSTNFLKLGYTEIFWMFAHVYFLQLLDTCW